MNEYNDYLEGKKEYYDKWKRTTKGVTSTSSESSILRFGGGIHKKIGIIQIRIEHLESIKSTNLEEIS